MAKAPSSLPNAEWIVMTALWNRRSATASDIHKDLEPLQGWAYSTVKTMLDRLVDKRFVRAKRVGNIFEYSAKVPRESAIDRVLDDVVDRVLEGSLSPFINRLVANRKLSRQEIAELRDILDRFESDSTEPDK